MPEWFPSFAAIVVALLGSGAGYLLLAQQRKKLTSESADIVTGAAMELVQALKTEIGDLRQKVGRLESEMERLKAQNTLLQQEIDELRRGARRLQGQIEALGQPPVWTVPPTNVG